MKHNQSQQQMSITKNASPVIEKLLKAIEKLEF